MIWTLHTFEASILVDDDDLSLVFYLLYLFCTQASFALSRPQTGGKEPAFSCQHGAEGEVGAGGTSCSSSYLSVNKSV